MNQAALTLPEGFRLHRYETLGSTNDEARRLARDGAPEGTLVWSLAQSAGKGRRGRVWMSPPGNLYLSLVQRPTGPPAQESGPTTSGFRGDELLQFPAPSPPPARAGGPPPPTAEQLAAAGRMRLNTVKQDFARLMLGMFAGSSPALPLTFTYVGKAEAPQGKADVLDVKGPAGPGALAARLFINADTHLPIMLTWTAPAPPARGGQSPPRGGGPPAPSRDGAPPATAGQPPPGSPAAPGEARGSQPSPPETRLYFGEYREVSGLQLPYRLRRALGPDTVEETTFDGYKVNAKIDPKKFEVRK